MARLQLLYIHGFGSRVDPQGDKQVALRKIADITAFAPDYAQPYAQILQEVAPLLKDVDLFIGTSAHADR